MKKGTYLLLLFLLTSLLLTGCNGHNLHNAEFVENLVDRAIKVTEKAIETKDVELARQIWGQISQYGVKADEMGKKELAEAVGQLASTYVYLIEYLESGDEEQLALFQERFVMATNQLKEYLNTDLEKK